MIRASRIVAIFLCVTSFSLLSGCRKNEAEKQTTETVCRKREAVIDSEVGIGQGPDAVNNPMLYQKHDSIENALRFIGAPEDEMEKYLGCADEVGGAPTELAKGEQLTFANKLFSLRRSKDVDTLMGLVSDGSKEQLDNCGDRECMLRHHIRDVKDGTFLYGKYDGEFFAAFFELTDEFLHSLEETVDFPEVPTHGVLYCRFEKILLGQTFYLIKNNHSYKLVTYTYPHPKERPASKKRKRWVSKQYGITAFEQFEQNVDPYTKTTDWKYQWDIRLSPVVSKSNVFEFVKVTKVISAKHKTKLHPDIAKQILINEAWIEKYKNGELKCTFSVGLSKAVDNMYRYGQRLTGWSYAVVRPGYTSKSSWMLFPGKNITNVRPNKAGNFNGRDLELLSFETTENSVKYEHKVVLRKKRID